MNHAADVAAIDSHPERNRRHHHVDFLGGEAILRAPALVRFHPGVIRSRAHALRREVSRNLLGVFSADAVNDRRLTFMPPDRLRDLRVHVQLRTHAVKQIGAIERSDQHRRIDEPKLLDDVATHALGRGRRVGVDARVRKARLEFRESAIFRPEVVPPLADTVSLVDREARNLKARDKIEKSRRQQPLRRDEYKMMPAAGELALDVANFHLVHPAVDRRRRIARQPQRIDLVLHQRDKRRDHDVGASSDRGRHLVA